MDVLKQGHKERTQQVCNDARETLKLVEKSLRSCAKQPISVNESGFLGQFQEMREQLTLAIRAVEDARMRCGKVLQYSEDGESIYDRVDRA